MVRAVVPGSFDPVTNGHLDIIARAASMFGSVLVSVARNYSKSSLFNIEERVQMLREVCSETPGMSNVSIDAFEGLLVHYASERKATVIVKGLRAVSDFEYELQMALMNRRLNQDVETVFLMAAPEHSYLSSSIVKEIARLGGTVEGLVPRRVEELLRQKLTRDAE